MIISFINHINFIVKINFHMHLWKRLTVKYSYSTCGQCLSQKFVKIVRTRIESDRKVMEKKNIFVSLEGRMRIYCISAIFDILTNIFRVLTSYTS